MRICVFTGPTLTPADAAAVLDAEYLPPAAVGDVYRAARSRPWAIGIVDGFFENRPSVWHKEVLWALAQGVHVFGAASMGALRGAELAPFGMVGVGAIFEAYRDGTIEDDDEVAVLHGPAELGYLQLSEAMVNIRATLDAAVAADVVAPAVAGQLVAMAKALYWKERSYERLLSAAAARQLTAADLAALRRWLPQGQVNRKRLDAVAMLQAIAAARDADPRPHRAGFVFEHTTTWDDVVRGFPAMDAASAADLPAEAADRAALLRLLARREAERQGFSPGMAQLQSATKAFSRRNAIASPADLDAWLAANGLDRDGFLALIADEARLAWLEEFHAPALRALTTDNGDGL